MKNKRGLSTGYSGRAFGKWWKDKHGNFHPLGPVPAPQETSIRPLPEIPAGGWRDRKPLRREKAREETTPMSRTERKRAEKRFPTRTLKKPTPGYFGIPGLKRPEYLKKKRKYRILKNL